VLDEGKAVRTYDLEVEDTHNFVVNEIHVHNSDPNIQNQPRDDLRLRYNFRAEPGMKLVTCDLNSVEMAVFAAYAGEGRIKDAVMEGADLHQMTADFVGIRDRARAGGAMESARQQGKTFNFAVIYGAGVRSMRKMMRCSQADARKYLKRYHDAYPEVGRLQARVEWKLEDQGFIKSALGRRFRIDARDAYRGVNYLVQGTAAEILKNALIKLHKDGIPIVALVHDEIICAVPAEDAEEVKHAVIEALCDFPQISEKVPLSADGDIVDRWSQAKNPDFKPRWDGGEG
jgi:DNA polymerase-1